MDPTLTSLALQEGLPPIFSLTQAFPEDWAAAGAASAKRKSPVARAFPMRSAKTAAESRRDSATVHERFPFRSRLISALPTSIRFAIASVVCQREREGSGRRGLRGTR